MKEEPDILFTTIRMAKTKRVSHPRLKPNGWIMIVQSILQVGVNSADSTEFTGLVEYPLYELKWTIDAILQHMGFYHTTENPCVMMRVNHKTKSCESIIIH